MASIWVGVYSKPQALGRAALGVEAAGIPIFLPFERVRIRHRGQQYIKIDPLFGQYFFAKVLPDRSSDLLEIEGVAGLLRDAGGLLRVPEELIEAFRRARSNGVFDHTKEGWLNMDELVKVVGGPLAGLVGRVKNARNKKRVEIIVDFVRKITVPIDNLERITA